jgi:hypothetical protein
LSELFPVIDNLLTPFLYKSAPTDVFLLVSHLWCRMSHKTLIWKGYITNQNIVAYRLVAKRWFCKQRPLLRNDSVNTVGRNSRRAVFSLWFVPRCYKHGSKLVEFSSVLYGRLWREDQSAWSWRISTVRSLCQGTTSEAGWKRLSGSRGDLWIVEVIGGAVIPCSTESRA